MPFLIVALGQMLAFIFKQVVVKFALFTMLFLVLTQFAPLLTSYLPNGANLSDLFNRLPSAFLWFLNITAFDITFPMIIVAYFTRFFIRRIPFIG